MLRYCAASGALGWGGKALGQVCLDVTPIDIETADNTGCPIDAALVPISPFILSPFTDPLPIPQALRPGYRNPDGTLSGGTPQDWTVRQSNGVFGRFISPPGPGAGQQDSMGDRPMANDGKTFTFFNPKNGVSTTRTLNFGGARNGTHQLWPGGLGVGYQRLPTAQTLWDGSVTTPKAVFDALNPNPLLYHVRLMVAEHGFTTSAVQPIDQNGNVVALPAGANPSPGAMVGTYLLPKSTIYGYNGTFPGPRINAAYGQPMVVRFENDLDVNPLCLNRGDFGSPDWGFLAHLHGGHTAAESDGQPNCLQDNRGAYQPAQWVDNLYLGYAAGGDDREKQSFLSFHDQRLHHAGPNTYKGMVGLMPYYDPPGPSNPSPQLGALDGGDETTGLRLPGVRVDNGDGTFDVKYDVPLVFHDCLLDDGITAHEDPHQPLWPQPWSSNACGGTHPEWWGKLFHQHSPNHAFLGDVFTTNGVAYPVLVVDRRHYRFRFHGASISRQYELSLRSGTVVGAPGKHGQWTFGQACGSTGTAFDVGTQVMKMTQIASDGGLLPNPVLRDSIQLWPGKRREVVIDFANYMDGSKTRAGDVIYLTNTAVMRDGRMQSGNLDMGGAFAVPLVKFIIGSNALAADASDPGLSPVPGDRRTSAGGGTFNPNKVLRPRHMPPFIGNRVPTMENMDFTLTRGSSNGATKWLTNGLGFDPLNPLYAPMLNAFELWGINNGGSGWTQPIHIGMEEHQVVSRTSGLGISTRPPHPEDPIGKEDVVALERSEQAQIWRGFRTFTGNYVAHSHNLAHADHDMMFGWSITL